MHALPFVDRDRELSELRRALAEADAGHGSVVLVAGESGIGKTRLLAEFAERAARAGARVVWGRCLEAGAVAYAPWIEVIGEVGRIAGGPDPMSGAAAQYLVQLVPELARGAPSPGAPAPPTSLEAEHARFYLFDAVAGFLRSAARACPLALVFDDVHWADESSLLLLRFLAGEIHDTRILALVAHRDDGPLADEVSRQLADLGRVSERMALQGLPAREVAALVGRVAGREPPAAVLDEIHRLTQGSPFFVDELARLFATEGRLEDDPPSIPSGVRQLLERRIGPLDEACRGTLEMASVIGREFALPVLQAASELRVEALAERLAGPVTVGIVEPVPDRIGNYRFVHGLLHETIYAAITEDRRRDLHRRVAETLEGLHGADPEPPFAALAFHYHRALPIGPASKAIAYAVHAGREAVRRLAYGEAAAYFARALHGMERQPAGDPALRCELAIELGEALARSAKAVEAAASFESALELARAIDSAELFARAALRWRAAPAALADWYDASGDVDERSIRTLDEALAWLPQTDSPLRARLLGRLAAALYWQPGSEPRRKALSDEGLAMARRLREPVAVAAALNSKRYARWGPDDVEERLRDGDEAIRLAERAGDRERGLQGRQWRIGDLLEIGDAYGADIEIDVYGRIAESLRQPIYRGTATMFRAMRALMRGRFAQAEALADEALRLGELAGNPAAMLLHGAQTFHALWEQGKTEALEAVLASIQAQAGVPATRCGVAFLLCELGRTDDAQREIDTLAAQGFRDLRKDVSWLPGLAVLARTVFALGDRSRARSLYELLQPYADRVVVVGPPVADCFGPVAHHLGLLATVSGRDEQAVAHFEAALQLELAMGALPAAARTYFHYGELLLRRGETAGGVARLRHARELTQALGMRTLFEQVAAVEQRVASPPRRSADSAPTRASLRRQGDYWTISYREKSRPLRDSVGLHYLLHLLRHPGVEFGVVELVALCTRDPNPDGAVQDREFRSDANLDLGHAGEVLDPQAKAQYGRRLAELRVELDRALARDDRDGAAALEHEMDFLSHELSSAYGLGGRARKAADTTERIRKAVSSRIRDTIGKIATAHPELARHLHASVRMGRFCSYEPDRPLLWDLGT